MEGSEIKRDLRKTIKENLYINKLDIEIWYSASHGATDFYP